MSSGSECGRDRVAMDGRDIHVEHQGICMNDATTYK